MYNLVRLILTPIQITWTYISFIALSSCTSDFLPLAAEIARGCQGGHMNRIGRESAACTNGVEAPVFTPDPAAIARPSPKRAICLSVALQLDLESGSDGDCRSRCCTPISRKARERAYLQ